MSLTSSLRAAQLLRGSSFGLRTVSVGSSSQLWERAAKKGGGRKKEVTPSTIDELYDMYGIPMPTEQDIPQWLIDWQKNPPKKWWELPPTDKKWTKGVRREGIKAENGLRYYKLKVSKWRM
ncbi:hypothetical protein QOT17_019783 [Balamuthia mandrillaris]